MLGKKKDRFGDQPAVYAMGKPDVAIKKDKEGLSVTNIIMHKGKFCVKSGDVEICIYLCVHK